MIAKFSRDYRLIDSGNGRKLESIAGITVVRPAPQVIWGPSAKKEAWFEATSICHRKKDGGGTWEHKVQPSEDLSFSWQRNESHLKFKLKFTSFGHCGIFFEQAAVWERLMDLVQAQKKILGRPPRLLNLFGYTGAASLAMAAAGGDVDHVDSAKGVLTWGQESLALCGKLPGKIRWIQEDALRFAKASQRKDRAYDGILADPPSWGHGTKKEVWEFENQIQDLALSCGDALAEKHSFFLLTSHTHGIQHECLRNLMVNNKKFTSIDAGELGIMHEDGKRILPSGIYSLGSSL